MAEGFEWPFWAFVLTCIGASFLYTGGMFLNDAFDVEFDRQFRKERPIPTGVFSASTVWIWGGAFLFLGFFVLAGFGLETSLYSILLVVMIIAYDAFHKKTMLSPLLMGACRFLVYLVAASVAGGITGLIVWHALVLALYIVGLSYIAKAESAPGPLRYWPMLLLLSPLFLAVVWKGYPELFLLGVAFLLWLLWSVRTVLWTKKKNIGATVSALLAGIVFVDALAVGELQPMILATFAVFFVTVRLFQKLIPAT